MSAYSFLLFVFLGQLLSLCYIIYRKSTFKSLGVSKPLSSFTQYRISKGEGSCYPGACIIVNMVIQWLYITAHKYAVA